MTASARLSAVVELTLARLREFVREPEALFWTFVFPIVMSVAMAVAFPRGRRAPCVVGIAAGPSLRRCAPALRGREDISLRDVPPGDELRALRDGEVHLIVVPGIRPPIGSIRCATKAGRRGWWWTMR